MNRFPSHLELRNPNFDNIIVNLISDVRLAIVVRLHSTRTGLGLGQFRSFRYKILSGVYVKQSTCKVYVIGKRVVNIAVSMYPNTLQLRL